MAKEKGIRERTYTTKDGKTYTRYEKRFMWNGARYSAYGDTPAKASKAADEMKVKLSVGTYTKNTAVTVSEYFEEWKAQKSVSVKESTVYNYDNVFINHLKRPLGRFKVRDVERRQVIAVLNAIAKKVSVNTANRCRVLLGQLFKAAMYDDIIMVNPISRIPFMKEKKPKPIARDTIHRALDDAEIKAFLGAARNTWYYHAFRFMMATGTRIGECLGLEWRDIDRKNGVIHIRRTVTRDYKGNAVIGSSPKTKKSRRDIPLNAEISSILEAQKEQCSIFFDNVVSINELVFPSTKRDKASPAGANMSIKCIIEKYNKHRNKNSKELSKFTAHAFRDTFASKASAQGVPMNVLKELLGHTSYTMTADLYSHTYEEQKKDAMKELKIVTQ